jgi:hypothetical protein
MQKKKPQISPLRFPGFPVEVGGGGEVHTAFLNESRTRDPVECRVQEMRERSGEICGTALLLGAGRLFPDSGLDIFPNFRAGIVNRQQ